ncbi:phosphotransferase [Gordonia sp. NPDC003376]
MSTLTTSRDETATATQVVRGQARTTAERAVEAALDAITEWAGRRVLYSPIHGGLQNENWRLEVDGEKTTFFLKIPGAGSEAFIDRNNAHVAATRAGALGISPRIVHFDPATGIEIIEFLEGYRACTNGDMKQPEITSEIIGLYRAFGSIEPLPSTKTVLDMIDEHFTQTIDLGVRLPRFWPEIMREQQSAQQALLAGGLDLVPCHNDPMPGNFLISEGKPMRLVDFEFSSNNERAYELAVMTTEFFYDDRRVMECVEDFYGATTPQTVARVQVCGFLADVKWGLWGIVNARLNDGWDFDYHKYGIWKLHRAQSRLCDPRWGTWIGSL